MTSSSVNNVNVDIFICLGQWRSIVTPHGGATQLKFPSAGNLRCQLHRHQWAKTENDRRGPRDDLQQKVRILGLFKLYLTA